MTETIRRARWQGALVAGLVACLLAVALGVPSLLFLAVVALGFVLVGQLSADPDTALRLERDVDDRRIRPGQSVTVTLSVTNEGERTVPDVRVADSPPEGVPVTDGSPAFATALRPGESARHRYELTPPRGEFAFGRVRTAVRSLTATAVATDEREPDGETTFSCETLLDTVPVQERTIQFVGRTPTDDGGDGIEFVSTREYRRGDPTNRIDWHRFARTGELATVEYREERAVTIVFVVDDRRDVHRNSLGGGPDSYDLTLYAASRGVVASLDDGNRTGVATLSGGTWIEPTADRGEGRRLADAIAGDRVAASDGAGTDDPVADGGSLAVELERRLPRRTQVVLCTPLTDRGAVELVETLRTHGRDVAVVSPDVTSGVTPQTVSPGARIASLERANRLDELRGVGATVVDWDLAEPISVELARAFGGRAAAPRGTPAAAAGWWSR
ncbi:DUF58 domain-containing protein [Natrarchaeobius oligotrophus]|uniref:DUF58 domain-containing protein n=1 Tax=Natrarchaeobius chitinivorans TaxID=1679083 RepID=A0A3N6MS21_NATCH|nr:DUF58 domain-containing protein [Natrarchaeobius chitinivorans]RQG97506.1 DUF58 domain-containing protein [Natrarchaeobius chitinivorans]